MSNEHPEKPTPTQERRQGDTVESQSPLKGQVRLSHRIEHLASELESSPIPASLDSRMLAQLDELKTLLRDQRSELSRQATEADEMLKQCRDELARTDKLDVKLDQMRQQQEADRQRDRSDRRKRAA